MITSCLFVQDCKDPYSREDAGAEAACAGVPTREAATTQGAHMEEAAQEERGGGGGDTGHGQGQREGQAQRGLGQGEEQTQVGGDRERNRPR